MDHWIVMSAVDLMTNNGVSFSTNATGLSEEEAKAEAERRNTIEEAAGHKGIEWFPAEDPFVVLQRAGFDPNLLKGLG